MWARIENGEVVETTNENPKDRFHESLIWILCRKTVQIGDLYDGQSFSTKTTDEGMIQTLFESAIQDLLDQSAKNKGYDSIFTAISYAEEPSVAKFQNDGRAFRSWRSQVWEYAYQELAKVKAGERPTPELTEFLSELPTLTIA